MESVFVTCICNPEVRVIGISPLFTPINELNLQLLIAKLWNFSNGLQTCVVQFNVKRLIADEFICMNTLSFTYLYMVKEKANFISPLSLSF